MSHEDDGLIVALAGELGAVAGGLVGLALPAGTRWVHLNRSPPLRVAGLTLHPGLHVVLSHTQLSEAAP